METRLLLFLLMGVLDRFTKKATENAVITAKETLNDKLETYSGIIKIGLTLGVIIFGSKRINAHINKSQALPQGYSQQPIIINNYYDRGYSNGGQQKAKACKRY